jgi:hypothetical protein
LLRVRIDTIRNDPHVHCCGADRDSSALKGIGHSLYHFRLDRRYQDKVINAKANLVGDQ